MVAGDGDGIEIPHLPLDEVLLHVSHHAQREFGGEDTGVLRLILFQDVRLYRATHGLQRLGLDARIDLGLEDLVGGYAQEREPGAVMSLWQLALVGWLRTTTLGRAPMQRLDLPLGFAPTSLGLQIALSPLIDGGVHEHRQQHGRGTVDGHGHRGRRQTQIEARIELFQVVERGDRYSRVTRAAVNVRSRVRILSIKSGRVECRRQARRAVIAGDVMEAAVRPFRRTLPGKHASWVLLLTPVRINAAGVGIRSRQILRQNEVKNLAPVTKLRHGELRHPLVRETLGVVLSGHHPVANLVGVGFIRGGAYARRPRFQLTDGFGAHGVERLVISSSQLTLRAVRGRVRQSGFGESF